MSDKYTQISGSIKVDRLDATPIVRCWHKGLAKGEKMFVGAMAQIHNGYLYLSTGSHTTGYKTLGVCAEYPTSNIPGNTGPGTVVADVDGADAAFIRIDAGTHWVKSAKTTSGSLPSVDEIGKYVYPVNGERCSLSGSAGNKVALPDPAGIVVAVDTSRSAPLAVSFAPYFPKTTTS